MNRWHIALLLAGPFLAACGDTAPAAGDAGPPDAAPDARPDTAAPKDAAPEDGRSGDDSAVPPDADLPDATQGPLRFTAVTFNVGLHPREGDEGITAEQLQYLDEYYGNGLAWMPAIEQVRDFLAGLNPAIVAFQEVFDVAECPNIPVEARAGFVCENWSPGDPTVPQLVLGPGYLVACNWHKHDKCVGIRKDFASLAGCDQDVCPDGLFGTSVSGCGSGARVARGELDLGGGRGLTVVHVHGTSGRSSDDMDCRAAQVEQVFVDLGDGEPGANGAVNLVLGDFNTDPRSPAVLVLDPSARRWADFVGPGKEFQFLNERQPTYQGLFCIDNMVSDRLEASCWYPGRDGHPAVSPEGRFDHTPTVCEITWME